MNKNIPYFTIGTFGIIVTAMLQICMTLFIIGNAIQVIFLILYVVFIAFLATGFWKLIKDKKKELI